MTLDDLVEQTLDLEGRVYAEPPKIDQPTGPGGVTLATLAAYRARPCTKDDLKALTVEEASAIIRKRFETDLRACGFDKVNSETLRVLLLDTEYNNGVGRAVRWLQRLAGCPVDGELGDRTASAVNAIDGRVLTNAYAAQRAHAGLTGNPKFANGLIARALRFVVAVDDN